MKNVSLLFCCKMRQKGRSPAILVECTATLLKNHIHNQSFPPLNPLKGTFASARLNKLLPADYPSHPSRLNIPPDV